jgi:nucleoid-associated protein Lsr2
MAQKTTTFLIDDLDGSDATETLAFGIDGTHYEIDLNASHADELRTALGRFSNAARRVSGTARRTRTGARKASADGLSNADVRSWAKSHGLKVSERGRLPADLIAKYRAAAGN